MPSAKDGQPGRLVSPVAPRKALDADDADPGKKSGGGGGGGGGDDPNVIPPFKPGVLDDPTRPTDWIEIELLEEDGTPVPGEPYSVLLPDGTCAEGTLDNNGLARIDGINPGSCQVTFPRLDAQEWN